MKKKPIREERTYQAMEMRLDPGTDGQPERIIGYAAVFGVLSEDLGGFREKIQRGAFSKTLQESDVRALFNHDPNMVLGRTKAGTLRMYEDTMGLRVEIDPPSTQWAQDLKENMRRGDINQMSFGFRTVKDEWATDPTLGTVRTLQEVALFDVSPVTFPAYPATSVGLRELMGEDDTQQDPAGDAAGSQGDDLSKDAPRQDAHAQNTTQPDPVAAAAAAELEILKKKLEILSL